MLEYARRESFLNSHLRDASGKSLGTQRSHLEIAASKGSREAISALDTGGLPESVSYLWDWAMAVHGRSGCGEFGFHPLTYATVAAWAILSANTPEPHEVDVLFSLDAILLNPPKDVN